MAAVALSVLAALLGALLWFWYRRQVQLCGNAAREPLARTALGACASGTSLPDLRVPHDGLSGFHRRLQPPMRCDTVPGSLTHDAERDPPHRLDPSDTSEFSYESFDDFGGSDPPPPPMFSMVTGNSVDEGHTSEALEITYAALDMLRSAAAAPPRPANDAAEPPAVAAATAVLASALAPLGEAPAEAVPPATETEVRTLALAAAVARPPAVSGDVSTESDGCAEALEGSMGGPQEFLLDVDAASNEPAPMRRQSVELMYDSFDFVRDHGAATTAGALPEVRAGG